MIKKIVKFIFDGKYRFLILSNKGFYKKMDDKKYLEKKFNYIMGYKLNLDNPITYNEKIQWLKLYDRKDIYTVVVDKFLVRDYVKNIIGEKYLIRLLGVWDSPTEINFMELPNKFVLKCNHNSGLGMCVCTDKNKIDFNKVKKNLSKGLNQNYYYEHREWPYKNVKPKIIGEEYIGKNNQAPDDYKFLVINGEIDNILVCKDRDKGKPKFFYFDLNWERIMCQKEEPIIEEEIKKPKNFEEMLYIVKKLSSGFSTIRVDLYNVDGKIYFGELTFYDSSGFETDITKEEDLRRGNKLKLLKTD